MSTKDSIEYFEESKIHLYEELSQDSEWKSPAFIQFDYLPELEIHHEDSYSSLTIGIPIEAMDQISIAWCKYRKLHEV